MKNNFSRHTRPPDRSKARQSKHQHGIGWHSIDSASCHLKLPGRASAASARWTAHLSHFFLFGPVLVRGLVDRPSRDSRLAIASWNGASLDPWTRPDETEDGRVGRPQSILLSLSLSDALVSFPFPLSPPSTLLGFLVFSSPP